jgi:hypothetical protein
MAIMANKAPKTKPAGLWILLYEAAPVGTLLVAVAVGVLVVPVPEADKLFTLVLVARVLAAVAVAAEETPDERAVAADAAVAAEETAAEETTAVPSPPE